MTSATLTTARPATADAAGVTLYWKVSGLALAAVAALGILLNAIGLGDLLGAFLTFDWTHNVVHAVLAALALALGFGSAGIGAKRAAAKLVGSVYLALGLVGLVSGGVFGVGDLLGLHLEAGENLVHLALGAWGAYVGFRG